LLRIAQIIGVLVLAGLAIGLIAGLLNALIGLVVIVAIGAGTWWLVKRVASRDGKAAIAGPEATRPTDRRAELEDRAVLDASGRCGWCGATSLHKDEFGFPVTPLAFHRAEIDAML
jgi:hypothetical protein